MLAYSTTLLFTYTRPIRQFSRAFVALRRPALYKCL